MMEPVDYMRSAALVVGFASTAFGSRATWIQTNTVCLTAFGLGYLIFPHTLLEFQVDSPLDVIHGLFGRISGVMLLTLAASSLLLRRSEDDNVWTSHFIAHVVAGFVMLQQYAYTWYKCTNPGLQTQSLTFGVLGTALWLAANLYQVVRYGKAHYGYWNSDLELDRLTRHVLLDAVLSFAMAFFALGYSEHAVSSIVTPEFQANGIHFFLYKCHACINVGIAWVAFSAVAYIEDEDKKKVLLSRIIGRVMLLGLLIGYQWLYHIHTSNVFLIGAGIQLGVIGNALAGYYCPSNQY